MCGIIGLFGAKPACDLERQVQKSLLRISHRGPDSQGIVIGNNRQMVANLSEDYATWALGHARLAILDLSHSGSQPMCTADRACWISYNGEIYNYLEIRSELKRDGFTFESTSDTEVILAAYRKWGAGCLERFNGMFAFVLVDLTHGTAFAARDRFGVKPLYFWSGGGLLAVFSELKQLIDFPGFAARPNRSLIIDFLLNGVVGREPTECFFNDVSQLPAGSYLQWPLGEQVRMEKARSYWTLEHQAIEMSWKSAVEEMRFYFEDAVRLRFRSDVSVGSCLSGGLDSSSIVCVARHRLGKRMHTFSSCYADSPFDESYYIDAVNKTCQAQGVKVYPAPDDIVAELDELAYFQDEPFGSLSVYAQWCVMRAAKQAAVRVLLDGQGGDETLFGYPKYWFGLVKAMLSESRFVGAAFYLVGMLIWGSKQPSFWRRADGLISRRSIHFTAFMRSVLHPDWGKLVRVSGKDVVKGIESFRLHRLGDITRWSLPGLLRYEDRNSMAHSVETRLPFLDYRLAQFCVGLPERFMFRRGRTKGVLIESVADVLPNEVLNRTSKIGFETPQDFWMRGRLGAFLAQRVRGSKALQEIIDADKVAESFADYRHGGARHRSADLFRVASLALWLDRFGINP